MTAPLHTVPAAPACQRPAEPARHGARRRRRAAHYPVLDAVAASFARLLEDPDAPLVRTEFGKLPLVIIRPMAADPGTPSMVRDAIWRTLVGRARGDADGAVWLLAAVGCALPRIRSGIWHATRDREVERDEACQAALAAFTEAVLTLDPVPLTGVLDELVRPAHNAAQTVADRVIRDRLAHTPLSASFPPPSPGGHPDFVLADLVRERVIDRDEADLIGRHRFEGTSLRQIAAERGDYPVRLSRVLREAEIRVARALDGGGES